MERDELLTTQEVADRLKVHVITVRVWLEARKLRGIKLGGRSGWRVRESDLAVFLAERETGP